MFHIIELESGHIKSVRQHGINHICKALYKKAGLKPDDDISEKGFQLTRSILSIKGEPITEVFWLGCERDNEGFKVAGGIFNKESFYGAYKLICEPRGERIMRAEIQPMEWEELIDLLYENLIQANKVRKTV